MAPDLLIVVFSLLGGCAVDPAFPLNDEKAAMPTNAKKAAYTRSYKGKGKTYSPMHTATGYKANGLASW